MHTGAPLEEALLPRETSHQTERHALFPEEGAKFVLRVESIHHTLDFVLQGVTELSQGL